MAAYVPATRTGNLVYTSGQLPMRSGELIATGKVGAGVSPRRRTPAPSSALSTRSRPSKSLVGELSQVIRVVKVVVFVSSAADFTGQAGVANGASELIGSVVRRRWPARALGRRDGGATARRASRGRADRRGRLTLAAPGSAPWGRQVGAGEPDDSLRRVPPDLIEHVSAYLSGDARDRGGQGRGHRRPAPRSVPAGPEVYLLRRHLEMAFAAGMYAFPGGSVDPRDFDTAIAWAGPTPAEWARRLDCDPAEARALVCAAMRETFEESGVLLAGTTAEAVVPDTTADDWEQDRAALVERRLSFTDFLQRRRLVLRTDLLAAWAHWITPEFEPRRYDTRFFLALMPTGQRHARRIG